MPGKVRRYHDSSLPKEQDNGTHRWKIAAIAVIVVIVCVIALAGTGMLKSPVAPAKNDSMVQPLQNETNQTPVTPFPLTEPVTQATIPVDTGSAGGNGYGNLTVSTGTYPGSLPVLIDGTLAGNASLGSPVSLTLGEGTHTVRVCSGTLCETAFVHVGYAINTSLNFERLLMRDAPLGFLNISTGSYPATLPVDVDGEKAGDVSPGKLFNATLPAGIHTVAICVDAACINNTVIITPLNQTSLDYGEQLNNDLPRGELIVSIGGYDAVNLPVFVDNASAGNVSTGTNLNVMLNQANHTVTVCAGRVCENQSVQIRFAKQSFVDFGDQLKRDAAYPTPTVRITGSSMSGNVLTVSVEFINPDTVDRTIAATISSVYSYSDSHDLRHSDSVQNRVSRLVKSGEHASQTVPLMFQVGTNIMVNDPVVIDIVVS